MSTMKGTVKAIKTKDWNGKTMYNLGVNTGGDKLQWVGFGASNPGVREESIVSFEYKENDKGFLVGNAKTVQVHKDEKPEVSTQSQAKPQGAYQDRQASITLQSATGYATEQLGKAADLGYFKPATNTKAAKEAALDAFFKAIDKRTIELQARFMDPDAFLAQALEDEKNEIYKEEDAENFDEGEPFNDDIPFG